MELGKVLRKSLDELFYPRSVAIVGAPRTLKTGTLFLMALLDQGFSGPIYPINPHAEEIDGIKAYPSVTDVPGPVDLAIILVPHKYALSAIRDCVAKKVKGAVLFTAGYKETGTREGSQLEELLVHTARLGGMRLVGPNGMGFYCPESGLAFFPQLPRDAGTVGVVSHSGSLTNILGMMGPDLGIRFSKVVSLGNECDLKSHDFFSYLANDSKTFCIGAYLEGVTDGRALARALYRASCNKPVVVWKMGLTSQGAEAAASHTGALACSSSVWKGVARQAGVVTVDGFDAWTDALMAFTLLPEKLGRKIAVISGPGGLAVSAAEACGSYGLSLAQLSQDSKKALANLIPPTGTSIKNPIDIGMTSSLDIHLYVEAAKIAAMDPGVDMVAVAGVGFSTDANMQLAQGVALARRQSGTPFMGINIFGFDAHLKQVFFDSNIPFFGSVERAMHTYAKAVNYREWQARQKKSSIH